MNTLPIVIEFKGSVKVAQSKTAAYATLFDVVPVLYVSSDTMMDDEGSSVFGKVRVERIGRSNIHVFSHGEYFNVTIESLGANAAWMIRDC